jgi:NRPS condensation-like uncharacterized protein
MNNYYKLDNAATVFPLVSTNKLPNSFRLACVLKEEVNRDLLLQALERAIKRYPFFKVCLKKGLFWFYLEDNPAKLMIGKEHPLLVNGFRLKSQNNYLFNLSCTGRRIALENSHILADGTAMKEFLKTILYHYFTLQGHEIPKEGKIHDDDLDHLAEETQDSYRHNTDKNVKPYQQEPSAFRLKGKFHPKGFTSNISIILQLDKLKEVTKKYDCTVGEYISAVLLESIQKEYDPGQQSKRPVSLFLPVNARKFFASKTLRNFVLYIRTRTDFQQIKTFEEIIQHVKETFQQELTRERLQQRIMQNIKLEKFFLIRIIPLFLKIPICRIGFRQMSGKSATIRFSNLGMVDAPSAFLNYIDRFEFLLGGDVQFPINATAAGYNNTFVLALNSLYTDRKFQTYVANKFTSEGLEVIIETNDLETY